MYKIKYILSRIQDIQKEECADLYKSLWWASALCQMRFCTPNQRLWLFLPPTPKISDVLKSCLQW